MLIDEKKNELQKLLISVRFHLIYLLRVDTASILLIKRLT